MDERSVRNGSFRQVWIEKWNQNAHAFWIQQINALEKAIIRKVTLDEAFEELMTVPGIGFILAMAIMLEIGYIIRFAKIDNFASYCRCVSSQRLSDGKAKGSGNRKMAIGI